MKMATKNRKKTRCMFGTGGASSCWMGLPLFALLLLFCFCNNVCAQPTSSCAPPSTDTYDWEKYDFYQVLGLSLPEQQDGKKSRKQRRKERSRFKSSDIRKAYRKQAQLFHPDKLASKKSTTTNNNATTLTKEESTARFARIAEAYEVLSDENKRYEYDELLLDCEDQQSMSKQAPKQQQQGYDAGNNNPWSFFDDLTTDPWHVFEDFFFGESSFHEQANNRAKDTMNWDDGRSQHFTDDSTTNPRRVYEREEFHYDPYRRVEVLRILRTEEFDVDPQNHSYYYRVIAQDFVEQHDPFHGWEYHPINHAFVIDEGYKREQQQQQEHSRASDNNFENSHRQYKDKLLASEALYPSSEPLLTSLNGRYYAGISAECEILVMSDDSSRHGPNVNDKVVWSSETFVPAAQLMAAGGCFLSLQGPRLVLALGNPEFPGSILWYSEVSRAEEAMAQSSGTAFFARLDNDGSLAVYSETMVALEGNDDYSAETLRYQWWSKMNNKLESYPWWKNFVEKATVQPKTRAAKAWVACRSWVGRTVLGQKIKSKQYNSSRDSSSQARIRTEETCIYATGMMGCNSSARKLLHVASDVKQTISHKVRHTVSRVDQAMDGFADYLNEEVEEDDDVLDTLLRVLSAAGRGIGRAGHKAARRGANAVRNTIEEHRYKLKRSK